MKQEYILNLLDKLKEFCAYDTSNEFRDIIDNLEKEVLLK